MHPPPRATSNLFIVSVSSVFVCLFGWLVWIVVSCFVFLISHVTEIIQYLSLTYFSSYNTIKLHQKNSFPLHFIFQEHFQSKIRRLEMIVSNNSTCLEILNIYISLKCVIKRICIEEIFWHLTLKTYQFIYSTKTIMCQVLYQALDQTAKARGLVPKECLEMGGGWVVRSKDNYNGISTVIRTK